MVTRAKLGKTPGKLVANTKKSPFSGMISRLAGSIMSGGYGGRPEDAEYQTMDPGRSYWHGLSVDAGRAVAGLPHQDSANRMAGEAREYNRLGPERLAKKKQQAMTMKIQAATLKRQQAEEARKVTEAARASTTWSQSQGARDQWKASGAEAEGIPFSIWIKNPRINMPTEEQTVLANGMTVLTKVDPTTGKSMMVNPDTGKRITQEDMIAFENQKYATTLARSEAKTALELEEFETKETIKRDNKERLKLSEAAPARRSSLIEAKKWLKRFESGDMASGAARKALTVAAPGVFTEQGRWDQEFDAFAERAARAMLKAMGEIRPTDADVIGAKRALFGVGKDEQVNIELLNKFIREQDSMESRFQELVSGGQKTIGRKTYDPATRSFN